MKNLFTLILFVFLQIITYAQNFGTDRIASPDTHSVNKAFISVAFNGWIYVAYNYNVVNSGFTGRVIEVSKDNGMSWEILFDHQFNPQNVIEFTSMIVAGTDTSNLRIFVTTRHHINQFWSGSLTVLKGTTGETVTQFITLQDGNTFGISDVAICSDYKHPYLNPNPYSVALAYSQYDPSGNDSILIIFSNDGGLNFTGPYFVATSPVIGNVDIAYGSYNSPAVGRYSIVWEQNGNIVATQSEVGYPLNYYPNPPLLDTSYSNLSGRLHNPVISIQSTEYGNASGDYTTVILAERYDSVTSSNDIVGFFNNDTQNGGFGYPAIVDSSADNTINPSISFDETNGNFLVTWYNQTRKELPCLYHDMNFPGLWITLTSNYADTSSFLNPLPLIRANEPMNDITVCWIQEKDTVNPANSRGILKYDATALPLFVSSQKSNDKFKIEPNVTTGWFRVLINKELIQVNSKLEIYNSLSKLVYSEKILQSNSDFIKNYDLNFSKGIYFITLSNKNKFYNQKIIIQ